MMFLFYYFRIGILFVRRQVCRVTGHKMAHTGYWEADPETGKYHKMKQCVRCRMLDRSSPDSICVRFDLKDLYAR
jgi:hypothetical protein